MTAVELTVRYYSSSWVGVRCVCVFVTNRSQQSPVTYSHASDVAQTALSGERSHLTNLTFVKEKPINR